MLEPNSLLSDFNISFDRKGGVKDKVMILT